MGPDIIIFISAVFILLSEKIKLSKRKLVSIRKTIFGRVLVSRWMRKNVKYILLFFIILSCFGNFYKSIDDDIKQDKTDSLVASSHDTIRYLRATVDSQRIEVDSFRKENRSLHTMLQDTVHVLSKAEIEAVSKARELIESAVAKGVERGVRDSKYIVSDAAKNKDDIKRKMDSMKLAQAQLPNITYGTSVNNPLKWSCTGDTLAFYLQYRNTGGTVAKNVEAKCYYLYQKNGEVFRYYQPFGTLTDAEIPAGETKISQKGAGCYMVDMHFDSTNSYQYVLVLGSCYNESEDKPVKKTFKMCYIWNKSINQWGEFTNIGLIEQALNAPDVKPILTNK